MSASKVVTISSRQADKMQEGELPTTASSFVQTTTAFSFVPTNLVEAMEYASIMAKSTMIPKCYQGKPGDVLIAIQLGAELGLKPLQSLQNVAAINGRPCIYGDAMLALVQATPVFENIKEYYDEEKKAAVCTVKRKNQTEHTVVFGEEDARKAGLWNKSNTPWITYPKRMLQMRARGFALRDKFADVLGGLITTEEAQDYPMDVPPRVTPQQSSLPHTEELTPALTPQQIKLKELLINACIEQKKSLRSFSAENQIRASDTASLLRGLDILKVDVPSEILETENDNRESTDIVD